MVPSYEYLSAAEVAKAVPKWTYKLGVIEPSSGGGRHQGS